MPGASRVGTIDPMGKTRIYTDETLRVVPAGSPEAAFVWKKGELDRRIARRSELGYDKNDEALRAQIDSHKLELAKTERKAASAEAEAAVLREAAKILAKTSDTETESETKPKK